MASRGRGEWLEVSSLGEGEDVGGRVAAGRSDRHVDRLEIAGDLACRRSVRALVVEVLTVDLDPVRDVLDDELDVGIVAPTVDPGLDAVRRSALVAVRALR